MIAVIARPPVTPTTIRMVDHDSWLAHDADVECPVYLVVNTPVPGDSRAHRWSIAWPVGTGSLAERMATAWKHIQLETGYDPLASEFSTPYVYLGALTKTPGPEVIHAHRYQLATTNLATRQIVEKLARGVPVPTNTVDWNCQNWIKELLDGMVRLGVLSSEVCDDAVAWAESRA